MNERTQSDINDLTELLAHISNEFMPSDEMMRMSSIIELRIAELEESIS